MSLLNPVLTLALPGSSSFLKVVTSPPKCKKKKKKVNRNRLPDNLDFEFNKYVQRIREIVNGQVGNLSREMETLKRMQRKSQN